MPNQRIVSGYTRVANKAQSDPRRTANWKLYGSFRKKATFWQLHLYSFPAVKRN